jgi:hypothetical protein
MATENQVKANRKNALKSTGPRTEEGKEASAQNAIKHGLRTTKNVIKTENQDEFDIFREKMIADISPDGAMEEMLAERIVSLSWRLKRAEHFQNAVIDALIEHGLHGASGGFGWTSENRERAQKEAAAGEVDVMLGIVINHDFANAKTLDMLLSYERRIESSLYRAIAELKKMRQAKNTENRTQDTEYRISQAMQGKENCTNEPNLKDNGWHPHAELGDGLETEHGTCANEPNSQYESSESHPHPEKSVQDEDATHFGTNEANSLQEYRIQNTEDRRQNF